MYNPEIVRRIMGTDGEDRPAVPLKADLLAVFTGLGTCLYFHYAGRLRNEMDPAVFYAAVQLLLVGPFLVNSVFSHLLL